MGSATRGPGSGVEDARIVGIHREVVDADILVDVEDAIPRVAAIARAEEAALLVWTVGMAERGDVDEVRV